VLRADEEPADLVAELAPACESEASRWERLEPVPVECDLPAKLSDEDRGGSTRSSSKHLPKSFAAGSGEPARSSYRGGQHDVARAVADVLGSGELLLVHAPTGTGKTLAYLVPALLWSVRRTRGSGSRRSRARSSSRRWTAELPRALEALELSGRHHPAARRDAEGPGELL
jgi:hypothetical protein